MEPNLDIHHAAIVAAAAAHFVLGGLWFGPLFGKAWARRMGLTDMRPSRARMALAFMIHLVGSFFMAFVLAHLVDVWMPSSWSPGAQDAPLWTYGFYSALFAWVGFFVPMQAGRVAWEGRGWGLFAINAGYNLVGLMTMGMILAFWR